MSRIRIRTVRNPVTPRKSVISGRGANAKADIDLIDIGAEPINRYGVVYITTIEAAQIAEHIGWVDGDIVRTQFAAMDAELRTLRAQVAELPMIISTTTEEYKDGLELLARTVNTAYSDRLHGVPIPDPEALPGWAGARRAAVELGDSGRAQDLTLLGDGDDGPVGEAVGGQPFVDGGDGELDEGSVAAADADGDGSDRVGESASGEDDAAGGDVGDADGAGYRAPTRITDLDAGDND